MIILVRNKNAGLRQKNMARVMKLFETKMSYLAGITFHWHYHIPYLLIIEIIFLNLF